MEVLGIVGAYAIKLIITNMQLIVALELNLYIIGLTNGKVARIQKRLE